MRFPGFGFSSPGRSAPSFRLSCPLGEQRVVISLGDEGQLRLRSKAGEVGAPDSPPTTRRWEAHSPADNGPLLLACPPQPLPAGA